MKFKRIVLLLVLTLMLTTLAACAGEAGAVGPAGPTGAQGSTGPQGATGLTGAQGSTGLTGAQGVTGLAGMPGMDGTNGIDGMDGMDGIDGMDGAMGADGAMGVDGKDVEMQVTDAGMLQWRNMGDTAWNDLVVVTTPAELEEPVNLVGSFKVLAKILPATAPFSFVTNDGVWTLDENAVLYDAAGVFVTTSDALVYAQLAANQYITDVVVVKGLVTELRFASAVTFIKSSDTDIVVANSTTSAAITLDYGVTVEGLLAVLSATDATMQSYSVMNAASTPKAVTTGVLDHGFTLKVKAEDGVTPLTFSLSFNGAPNKTLVVLAATPTLDEIAVATQLLTVRPGTAPADLLTSIRVVNADYDTTIEVFNSELVAKSVATLATGDKVLVTAIDGTKLLYQVAVAKGNNTALKITDTAVVTPTSTTDVILNTETVINYVFDATLDQVVASLEAQYASSPQTNTWAILASGVLYTFDGTNFVAADDTVLKDSEDMAYTITDKVSVLQAAGTLGLVVKASDGTTTKAYTLNENNSTTTAVEPVAGNKYVSAAMEATTGNTIAISSSTTVAELAGTLVKEDGSTLGTVLVKKSDASTRTTGLIYTNDTVVVTSESGVTASYLVTVGAKSTITNLPLKAAPVVITSGEFSTLLMVLPSTNSGSANVATTLANIEADLNGEGMNFQTYTKLMLIPAYTDTATPPVTHPAQYVNFVLGGDTDYATAGTQAATLNDLIIRVKAQSFNATTNATAFTDYDVMISAKSANSNIEAVVDYDETLIQSYSYGFINVHYQKLQTNGTYTLQNNITAVIAEFNFAKNFQTRTAGRYLTAGDPTTWVPGAGAFADIVVRVFAESYHATTNNTAYTDYAIDYFYNSSTMIVFKDTVKVADPLQGLITVDSAYWNGSIYAPTLATDVTTDLNAGANFQTITRVMLNPQYTYAVAQGTTTLPTMYVPFVLGQDKDGAGAGTAVTTLADLIVRVTAQNSTTALPNVQDYPVYVKALSSDTMLHDSVVEAAATNGVFVNNNDNTITVANGSTYTNLVGALNIHDYFQAMGVTLNDGTNNAGTLNSYDVLTITAQDGTVKEYTIMVAAAAPAGPSTSTAATFGANFAAGKKVADLLTDAETANPLMTFEVVTSEGSAKTEAKLFAGDLVIVTAEDGTTTQTYIIS